MKKLCKWAEVFYIYPIVEISTFPSDIDLPTRIKKILNLFRFEIN